MIFQLPAGFRPGNGISLESPNVEGEETISVLGSGVSAGGKDLSGAVFAIAGKETIANLSGITFKAEG